ncbi:MAG: hypothetical protein LUG95_08345 [Clostridiales bacterium]|nr:hypothetical protein [Clostridiales bacterium]
MNKATAFLRRVTCYLLSMAMALTLLLSALSIVISFTLGDSSFMNSRFTDGDATTELSSQLDERLGDISLEYGY